MPFQDFRYAFRVLARSRGFAFTAIAALGLGIGANTAMFSVVNTVLLRPLPYPQPDRLVAIFSRSPKLPGVLDADFAEWKAQNRVFAEMGEYSSSQFNLTGASEPQRVTAAVITAGLFKTLGVRPLLGRDFLADENQAGRNRVAILSHALWQTRFAGDPHIVGQAVRLDGEPYTVAGVMPAGFAFPAHVDLWAPLVPDQRGAHNVFLRQAIARLALGVTLEQAQADMDVIAHRLAREFPKSNAGLGVNLVPLRAAIVRNARFALLVLLGAVGFVLLIACANVANLLLARAVERQRETAIRTAVGASRGRLIRQFLSESCVLALAGGGLGLALAVWGIDALARVLPAGRVPRAEGIGIDGAVLGFALGISLLTGIVFGMVPALQATRPAATLKPELTLRRGGLFGPRALLVVSQVALACVLLTGAGLMAKSFVLLNSVPMGFRPQHVLALNVALPDAVYGTAPRLQAFYRDALERLGAVPGVRAAALVNALPLSHTGLRITGGSQIEGRSGPEFWVAKVAVSPDYFRVMGIPLRQGRYLADSDSAEAPAVAIVSESLARRFWARPEEALGRRVNFGIGPREQAWRTIAGVVGDVRQEEMSAEPRPTIYVPFTQVPMAFFISAGSFVVRTEMPTPAIAPALRRAVRQVDKDQPVYQIATLEQLLADSVAEPRLRTSLLGGFALLAVALAMVGTYGVISFSVSRRTREIGVRMALGARQGDVLRLVLRQGVGMALAGVALGLLGALALTRLLRGLLFQVSATDPVTFAATAFLLLGIAALASYLPARRAARVDPITALRYE